MNVKGRVAGVALEHPVLTAAGRAANFTNEASVDGTVRFLHNVMGLWLRSESSRQWEREGTAVDLPTLVSQAGAFAQPVSTFDANDPRLLAPGDIPARITGSAVGRRTTCCVSSWPIGAVCRR